MKEYIVLSILCCHAGILLPHLEHWRYVTVTKAAAAVYCCELLQRIRR